MAPVAGFVEGEREAPAEGSGEGALAAAAAAAEGSGGEASGPSLLRSLDYPCTARFRLRRLIAYLRWHGYADVYFAARKNMPVIFHPRELAKKVRAGEWREAAWYVRSYYASLPQSSHEARLLFVLLQDLGALNDFSDGRVLVPSYLCDWYVSIHKQPVLDKYPCFAAVVADVLFMRSDHASALLDWQLIRKKAAKMVEKMTFETPELRDKMDYPRGPNNLYSIMPIGSRCHEKKKVKAGRKQSTDLAYFYLQMKKRLPSSQGANHSSSAFASVRGEPLIALFETSLVAGRRPVHEQGQSPEDLSKEGFPLVRARLACGCGGYTLRSQGPQSELHSQGCQSELSYKLEKKRSYFQESQRDTVHPGNDRKRPRTTGNLGEDPSSSFKGPHLVVGSEGNA